LQTKRIEIIPALHGKLTRDGKLSEPDIYFILEQWLERHPTFKGRENEIRIVTGRWTLREGIRTEVVSVSAIGKRFGAAPELLDRVFGVESLGAGITARVGPVPSGRIGLAGCHDAAARHLEMAVGVGLLHPFPRVAEPDVAFGLGLEGEPGDLVPSPDERRFAGLARIGSAEVVELDQKRKMLTRPAARSDSALTLQED
jgi:hypothetical protein